MIREVPRLRLQDRYGIDLGEVKEEMGIPFLVGWNSERR